jgi:hypothetical protein
MPSVPAVDVMPSVPGVDVMPSVPGVDRMPYLDSRRLSQGIAYVVRDCSSFTVVATVAHPVSQLGH